MDCISISCIPMPTFIEGNFVTFQPGDTHPNRDNLQYFIIMFVTEGVLYIAEDGVNYTVLKDEIFILQPNHHHYSWKKFDTVTSYYWIHFYVPGEWLQYKKPIVMHSKVEVPTLHYRTPIMTIHLPKQSKSTDLPRLSDSIKTIFNESSDAEAIGFWRTQQVFIDILQEIQIHSLDESKIVELSVKVQAFLRDNYNKKITNKLLASVFHFHPNYIGRSLKQTIGLSPNEFLVRYRMEEAQKQLLNTNASITEIAENVGFQNVYYFSTAFKQFSGLSPKKYRMDKK